MILIITHKRDFTADYVINILNSRGIAYKRLNCEEILSSKFSVSFSPEFRYSLLGQNNYSSVWFRRTMLPELKDVEISEKHYILAEIEHLIKNLISVIDAKWLSNPEAIYKAENKLHQLKKAKETGFQIPKTIVTVDKKEVVDFYHKHQKIIVKPIAQTRIENSIGPRFIFTNQVREEHIENIGSFDLTPCIFQKEIEKDVEIRVTVVGGHTFAALVKSQDDPETRVDWRKKKLKFFPFSLPSEVHNRCVELVREMGLLFGAIDLILSPDGSYTFLEINPNGQWVWIEMDTGLKISEAIINELIGK
jgi:glutathione synthase/RimK-type ligase-like ATP-grasp enzyme